MSWLFAGIITFFIFAIEIGIIILIFRKFHISFTGGLPKTTLIQSYKNSFFTGVPILAIYGIFTAIAFWGFRQSLGNALFIAFGILWVMTFCYFLFGWFRSKYMSGKVTLEIRPFPNKNGFIFNAVLWIILGFIGSLRIRSFLNLSYAPYISILFAVSFAIYSLLIAFGSLQVREKGILVYADLICWERIESFEWAQGNEKMYTIKFKFTGRLPSFMRNGALAIPVEKKNEFDAILKYRLSNKAATTTESA